MKPSRLVTFATATSHRAVRASGQASVLTGIWPGSPSRRWGIELTEGQPDTSANKANEKKSRTMKKLIAVAGLGAAVAVGSLLGAGTASADSGSFVNALNANGWHDIGWSGSALNLGYRTCGFLNAGYSWNTVVNDVYYNTTAATSWSDANQFVSLADSYLC